jgi:hypothetical protein
MRTSTHRAMRDPLAELAQVVGLPGALALASFAGGDRVAIPKEPKAGSWLVVLFGELIAGRLCTAYGGTELSVPLPPVTKARVAMARQLRADGLTIREIARRLHVSERAVYDYFRKT